MVNSSPNLQDVPMESTSENDNVDRRQKGCFVCRSRKVKCDKTLDGCNNCRRLGIQCPGYRQSPKAGNTGDSPMSVDMIFKAAGIEKRKTGACLECRFTKNKCTRERPKCQRCFQRSLECTYASKNALDLKSKRSSVSDAQTQPSPSRTYSPASNTDVRTPLTSGISQDDTDWLYSDSLPTDKEKLKALAETYFERVHTLRCLGFIHKPTFIRSLDRGSLLEDYGEALIHVIFALGSRHIAFINPQTKPYWSDARGFPGQAWAQRAHRLVFDNISQPSIRNLMALVLLCEYSARTAQNASIFILVGCCYRLARLLELDSQHLDEIAGATVSRTEATQQESKRRIFWSCYVLDTIVASGVEENMGWRGPPPRIPLPRPDQDFIFQIPSRTFYLDNDSPGMGKNLGIRACTVRILHLRTEVLRLVREDRQEIAPWEPNSPFLQLVAKIDAWRREIPDEFALTDLNVYIHKEQHILGAVTFLHMAYHSAVADLTRIVLPGYTFPLAQVFDRAPPTFKAQCQDRCRFHADEISQLIEAGWKNGERSFDDILCTAATFESTKIQILYATTVASHDKELRKRTERNIRTNVKLLDYLHVAQNLKNPYLVGLLAFVTRFGFNEIAAELRESLAVLPSSEDMEIGTAAKFDHLSRASFFRIARQEIQPSQLATSGEEPSTRTAARYHDLPPIINSLEPGQILPVQHSPARQSLALNQAINLQPGYTAAYEAPNPQNTEMLNDTDMLQLTEEDYMRMASEMSEYITWDTSNLGSWWG